MRKALLLGLCFYTLSLAAQNAGVRDNSFASNGIVLTTVAPALRNCIYKLLQQPDGKIVAIGTTNDYSTAGNIALARYNLDGTLDNSFGTGGIVTRNTGGWSSGQSGILQADGKIVVVGFKNQGAPGSRAIVLRFNANGSVDNTYDGDGMLEVGPSTGTLNFFNDIEKDVSGNYYVAGNFDNGSGNTDFAVVRLTSALAIDNSFGVMGIAQFATDAGWNNYCRAISIQSNGKIVGTGRQELGGDQRGILFRLNTNGTIDNSFGGTGWFQIPGASAGMDLAVQSSGQIVCVGFRYTFEAVTPVLIYDANGMYVSGNDRANRNMYKMVLLDDDRFLLFGSDGASIQSSLLRYAADGTPQDLNPGDPTLIDALTNISAAAEYSSTGIVQADGKYLTAGLSGIVGSPNVYQFALVRYLGAAGEIGLPVGLIDFAADKQQEKAQLSWSTAFEQNNKGFEIQRSMDGRNYSAIGWVAGAGNSNSRVNYTFTDIAPAKGNNYYRLKQVDLDEHYKISPVRKLVFTGAIELAISPNPATDKMTLRFTDNARRALSIADMQGKIYWEQRVTDMIFVMPVQQLPRGVYLLSVSDDKGNSYREKFIKE